MDVLALMPAQNPQVVASEEAKDGMLQQLLRNAMHGSSSIYSSSAAGQGPGEQHVGAELRAHMLHQLLLKWTSRNSGVGSSAVREGSTRVVVNLCLPPTANSQTRDSDAAVRKKRKVSGGGSTVAPGGV
jgi:hypothetical protein